MNSEIILSFLVALIVFGPNKLPMLAEHLGKLLRQINLFKQQASLIWHNQIKEQQLQENNRKAEKADLLYYSKQNQEKGLKKVNCSCER